MATGSTQFHRYRTAPRFPTNSPPCHQFINAVFFVNSAEFNYLSCSISNIPRAPAAFPFLFTSILEFLQLKYQGKQETPFDTHPFITLVGIVSSLVYCYLEYYTEQYYRFSLHSLGYRMRVGKYVTGSVSLASTVSILFPDSIRPILFVIFLLIAAVELLHRRIWEFIRNTCSRNPEGRQILPL